MRIIVAGGRDFDNYEVLEAVLATIIQLDINLCSPIEIISGTAKGADKLGERYAEENGYYLELFPPNWTKLGRPAGFIRNERMAQHADTLVAFWDHKSKGTEHMIEKAKQYGLLLVVIPY